MKKVGAIEVDSRSNPIDKKLENLVKINKYTYEANSRYYLLILKKFSFV